MLMPLMDSTVYSTRLRKEFISFKVGQWKFPQQRERRMKKKKKKRKLQEDFKSCDIYMTNILTLEEMLFFQGRRKLTQLRRLDLHKGKECGGKVQTVEGKVKSFIFPILN